MKRALSLILSIILVFSLVPAEVITVTASAETTGATGQCTWTRTGTVLTISGEGAMGNYSYNNRSPWGDDITEVIIENGVTTIGSYAFYFCTSLKSISVPNGLKSIGDHAFYYCKSLLGIVIPNGVTSIGGDAFYYCKISEIILPDSLTSIGKNAFALCYLTSARIPENVSSIGAGAFSYCSALTSIEVDENNSTYYSANNCIIKKSTNALVAGCKSSVIPNGVTSIEERAFGGCSSRINMAIPEGLTKIGTSAFVGSDYTSITMPKSIKSIASNAFYLCRNLTDVYYSGNKVDRSKITIGASNEDLTSANWHYAPCENDAHAYNFDCTTICRNCDYVRTSANTHTFDNDCDEVCNICGEHRKGSHVYEQTGENTATCKVCNLSKAFDFIITTDETITLSYNASKEFDFSIEDTSVAKIVNVSSSIISSGSYYQKSSSAKISPVYLGDTIVKVVDVNGTILTTSTLLVVEGQHQTQLAETIIPATCIDNGVGIYRCKFCDYEEQGVVYAPVHIEVIDANVTPTCTETGLTEGKHCSRCGEVLVAQETIPATGHSWANETPDENDNLHYECSVCQDTYVKVNIKNTNIELDENAFQYHMLFPNLPVSYLGKDLSLNEDYELIYSLGEKTYKKPSVSGSSYIGSLGTCTITVRGINQYFGEKTFDVDIRKFNMSNAHLMTTWVYEGNGSYSSSSYDMKEFVYDGREKKQSGYRVCDDNDTVSAEHYVVTYKNNVKVGTATMIITGVGDYYTGKLEKQFNIYPRAIQRIEISKLPKKLTYNRCQKDRTIDVTGGQITVYYEDGGKKVLALTSDMLDSTTFTPWAVDENVWVRYEDVTTSYQISIYSKHIYSSKVTHPTNTKTGYTDYSCFCGDSYRDNYTSAKGLPAPAAKIASDAKTGKPVISWKAVPEATSYGIYRATSKSGNYTKLSTITKLSYTDATATAGKTYYYRLVAEYKNDNSLNSQYSKIASVTIKCGQPTIKVKQNSKKQPAISWGKVSGAKKYDVYYATGKNGTYKKLTSTTKTSYTHTKASAGKEYYYKVCAYSTSSTTGAFSAVSRSVVKLATPSLTVTAKNGQATIKWKKLTGATKYELQCSVNGGAYKTIATVSGTSYTHKGLAGGNKYTYRLCAKSAVSDATSAFSATKAVSIKCAAPTISVSLSGNKPVIKWSEVSGAAKYQVYYATSKSGKYKLVGTVTGTSFTHSGAPAAKACYYKVLAVDKNGTKGAYSSAKSITTKCVAPATVKVTLNSKKQPVITWSKASGAKKYEVYVATSQNGTYKKLTSTSKLTYTYTKAKTGTTYYFKIAAYGSSTSSRSSYSAIVKTP